MIHRRDDRIDFWRGLCLVGMVCWHLVADGQTFPRWFSFGVIQAFNFVAEGFVLLAGTAVAIVMTRRQQQPPPTRRYLRRALRLLLVHYGVVVVIVLGSLSALRWETVPEQPWQQTAWEILTLQCQPGLGDVLSIFVLLFAATPVFLAIHRAWGAGVLFGMSFGIYLLHNAIAVAAPPLRPWIELNQHGAFDFNTWQFVFVCGLLLGLRREQWFERARRHFRLWLVAAMVAFAAAGALRLYVLTGQRVPENVRQMIFSRQPLSPARLVYIGLEMFLIGLVTLRLWGRIGQRWIVQAIALWGRHSLTIFVASVFANYLLTSAMHGLGLAFPATLVVCLIELTALHLLARHLDGG